MGKGKERGGDARREKEGRQPCFTNEKNRSCAPGSPPTKLNSLFGYLAEGV